MNLEKREFTEEELTKELNKAYQNTRRRKLEQLGDAKTIYLNNNDLKRLKKIFKKLYNKEIAPDDKISTENLTYTIKYLIRHSLAPQYNPKSEISKKISRRYNAITHLINELNYPVDKIAEEMTKKNAVTLATILKNGTLKNRNKWTIQDVEAFLDYKYIEQLMIEFDQAD